MATTTPTTLPFPTINVVPAGYRWSTDAMAKAGAKGAFLRVGGAQVSRRFLSGATRSWKSLDPAENTTIFHTGYRITGTPEAVQIALRYAGIPENTIAEVLATSITRDNFGTTMSEEYAKEIQKHNLAKQAKPVTEFYQWEQIMWFADNIKSAVIETKSGERKGNVTSPGRAGAGESIADKIKKLIPGKVLDVSNIDINTGRGVRTLPAPKTAKSGKFGTLNVPIISNNIDNYVRAIQLAFGEQGERTYANDIAVVRQALTNTGKPNMVVPLGGQRVPSPPKVIGGQLAPVPVFQPQAQLAPVPTYQPLQTGRVPKINSPKVGTFGGTQLPNIPRLTNLQ
jgi:hypothetical protein